MQKKSFARILLDKIKLLLQFQHRADFFKLLFDFFRFFFGNAFFNNFRRGKNQNKPSSIKRAIINVGDLERMISIPEGIKILGGGEVTKAFTIHKSITLSKIARAKIEKAGGTIS